MRLSKDFLCTALKDAEFIWNDTHLSHAGNEDVWLRLEQKGEFSVSIDSRTLQADNFFIPLQGPHFDGHNFIQEVLHKGAIGSLVAQSYYKNVASWDKSVRNNKLFIVVPDVMQAFITLAQARRKQLTCPIVGVTGSVGKSTTKEMLRTILHTANIPAYVSIKTYNTDIGVCYSLLNASDHDRALILEMGINEVGEMMKLADIVRPDIGVITTIAHAHLAGLGNSLSTVAYEKRQLFAFFTAQQVGIVSGDQPLLHNVHYAHPVARFGLKIKNQVQARKIQYSQENGIFTTTFMLKCYEHKESIQLKGNHPGFINNALAASSVAYFLKVPFNFIVQGLQQYQGMEQRFEIKKLKRSGGFVLNDCYNANPENMKAALQAFAQFQAKGPKIAVLGDMLELGAKEDYWHRQIGRVISKIVPDLTTLILVGQRARHIGKTAPTNMSIIFAKDWQEAQHHLESYLAQDDSMILVKASHGMHLEHLVNSIAEE